MKIIIASLLIIFSAAVMPAFAKDRALVVGVDVYANRQVPATPGATDDAIAMQKLLIEELDFEPGSVKILLDSQATAREIVRNFETWLIDGTRPGDRVFFFYAGHGFQAPDDNGDEKDNLDEVITPYDVSISVQNRKIVLPDERTFVRDDKFNDFIAQLSGRRVVLMFDSCHSGTLSRGFGKDSKVLPSRYLRLKQTRSLGTRGYSDVPKEGRPRDISVIKEDVLDGNINGVVVLSAASPYQQAFPIETGNNQVRGAFSYIFEQLIRRNPKVRLGSLENGLKREMEIFANRGMIGKGSSGQYQVPQVDVISRVNLKDKPLFGSGSGTKYAAIESALFNPFSSVRVRLELSKRRFRIGDNIEYTVDVNEDSYLYILVFSSQNKAFCVFPTVIGGDTDNFVRRGRISFPRDDYITEATEPTGTDVWVALASRKKLLIGEKQEYTWDEVFKRIGLDELGKAIVRKTRGVGNRRKTVLGVDDWQAAVTIVETVR